MQLHDPNEQLFWHQVSLLLQEVVPLRQLDSAAEDVAAIRQRVRTGLKGTHDQLSGFLSERDAYYVLFALVAHMDEIAQVHVQAVQSTSGWQPLQFELFGLTEAGDLFYAYADSFKGRNDIPQLVFEAYYFCINDGFKGRFIGDPDNLAHSRKELAAYIRPVSIKEHLPERGILVSQPYRPATWMYYAALLLFLAILNVFLSALPLNIENKI